MQLNANWLKKIVNRRDDYGYNAWHRVVRRGRLEALETLWSLAKEAELNTDELLLAQTRDRYTAFLLAAEINHVGILKRMWVWAEKSIVLLLFIHFKISYHSLYIFI